MRSLRGLTYYRVLYRIQNILYLVEFRYTLYPEQYEIVFVKKQDRADIVSGIDIGYKGWKCLRQT